MRQLIFYFCGLALTCQIACAHTLKTPMPQEHEVEERINRVINGLLPETAVENQFGEASSLKDRMAYYRTPGLSIAVIDNYKIAWARGFGFKKAGKKAPVTNSTLFQAASISKPILR